MEKALDDDAAMEEGTDSEAGEIDLAVDFMEPGQEVPPEDEPSPEDDPMQVDDEPLSLVEYQNIGDHLQPEPDEEYISEHTLVFDLDNHLFSRARQSPVFQSSTRLLRGAWVRLKESISASRLTRLASICARLQTGMRLQSAIGRSP